MPTTRNALFTLCLTLAVSSAALRAQDILPYPNDTLAALHNDSLAPADLHPTDTLAVAPNDSNAPDELNPTDTLALFADTLALHSPLLDAEADSLFNDSLQQVAYDLMEAYNDTANLEFVIDRTHWMPDPKKALWLAIAFPGGGQIYNRKYWKLPLFYGGFLGCLYAMNWNNTMYHDYSQAYIDIMDDDDNSTSYMNFIPETYDVESNLSRLQSLFKKKKDYYRRYRDLSFICLLGVYALSILDAYIDAELSSFDISRDLSMKIRPSVINQQHTAQRTNAATLQSNSYGLQCAITF